MTHGQNPLGIGLQHHRRHDIAVIRVLSQGIINRIFGLPGILRHVYKFFRPPINLAALVVHDALAKRLVGGRLVGCAQGGVHIQAARVGLVTVLVKHQLTHGFCNVFRMDAAGVRPCLDDQFFSFGRHRLRAGDKAVVFHALNDVKLPGPGTFWVDDRVVCRWGFGQTREHGGFSNADVLERFAKVSF